MPLSNYLPKGLFEIKGDTMVERQIKQLHDAGIKQIVLVVGYLKDNGLVQDTSYRVIGHIKDDGTVQDASYRIIGHIRKDGLVQDASYRTIGHADGIPMKWAAWHFFFSGMDK